MQWVTFVKLLSLKKKKKKKWKLKNKFYFSSPTFYLRTWDNHINKNFTISLVLRGLKIPTVENPEYLNNICLNNLVKNATW